MTEKVTLMASRGVEFTLALLGAVIILVAEGLWAVMAILAWDLIAVGYVAIRVWRLKRSKRADAMAWLDRGLGGRVGLLFTVFTSLVGITAGLSIIVEDGDKILFQTVGLPCVFLAWTILHFGYAERYAKDFYAAAPDDRPLEFPNCPQPSFVEFAYFSFTLGTTFSVSDVETRTSTIRGRILAHSILSFVYNTATIGIAVSVLTGLTANPAG